ncbi:alpha-1,6-mannosylglycoprotein 6-beta-N-acetylglucosaminyltransferase A-like [Anneissia japonica]|uniref:alpha-1,6-mannosylglycoprotein 6-beta-N-acetylglucosaminyltransferase A-like n=1 Tax=Anneissia japonica TaxID=1529436 RepID=UPI001425879F|nr:alpha-1,6-mannosylglycoprotein 6-beta-N-acetylglucosaminyltransferase A-like [Anneissia japonica]XP_033107829.1 alpha-1,6-mannosylglycoprotein 6-beta-N-acetylglucosaminyltransferase A-like [Anneissia japonica]
MARNSFLGRSLTSKKIQFFLMTLMMMWISCMLMIFQTMKAEPPQMQESERLRKEILEVSQKYIQALALEHSKGGQVPDADIAHDLKKTITILLDNLIERIDKLEQKVDTVLTNNTFLLTRNVSYILDNPGIINLREYQGRLKERFQDDEAGNNLLKENTGGDFKVTECDVKTMDLRYFPNCNAKLHWMRKMWKTDKCYADFGVNGTQCSFIIYLSEVENWCPKLQGRTSKDVLEFPNMSEADVRLDKNQLMDILDSSEKFEWIRTRINTMWESKWRPAGEAFLEKYHKPTRLQKKILIHMGLLTKESGFKIAENAFHGGPLGELVQWSDIIASLYILGHDITISISTPSLKSFLKQVGKMRQSCPMKGSAPFQIIYIDIVGLKQFKKTAGEIWQQFSCMFRVIDSFGTEPAFNLPTYMKKKHIKSAWGKWGLIPSQFFTMFPHTPDNSFMGFVVDQAETNQPTSTVRKSNSALVYGKKSNMWADATEYVDIIHSKFTVHATVFRNLTEMKRYLPNYVINHGIVSGQAIQQLLRETKLFVGLGFPYEGPAPLEAIANGCVFLNPLFIPPKNSLNTKFFKDKPTTRQLTSQHPYAEQYIGKPYVHTVDISNTTALEMTLAEIVKQGELPPHLPFEFSCEGMLQRLSIYIQNQEFCGESHWPPKHAMKQVVAQSGESCKDTCSRQGFICEPAFFKYINNKENFQEQNIPCMKFKYLEEIIAPSWDQLDQTCYMQSEILLFSCAGNDSDHRRMCPCRDFIKEQIAICTECL